MHNTQTQPPTVLRCNTTADFLAALPFATGFTDQNSLFVALFHGKQARDVLRVQLPDHTSSASQTDELIDGLVELLYSTGAGAEGPAFVLCTAESFADRRGVPYLRLARRLQRRMRREGWFIRELAVIASDGWAALLSNQPEKMRSLSEISRSEVNEAARAVQAEPENLDNLSRLPEQDTKRAKRVAKCLRELELRDADRRSNQSVVQLTSFALRRSSRVAEACFSPVDDCAIEPRLVAKLVHAVQQPCGWFSVALTALTRADFVEDFAADETLTAELAALSFTDEIIDATHPVCEEELQGTRPTNLHRLLRLMAEDTPDAERLRQAAIVLADACTHAPEQQQPAVYAMLAWVWWMLGLQSVAHSILEQSQQLSAKHASIELARCLAMSPPPARLSTIRESYASAA